MEATRHNITDIESAINDLNDRKSQVSVRKTELEVKLGNLNNAIRGRGRLPDHEYQSICNQQDQLKRAKVQIEMEIAEINSELRKKNNLKERLRNELSDKPVAPDIITHLVHLKNHYINFAADKSRVGSMRQMAAEFAEKIEDVIQMSDSL